MEFEIGVENHFNAFFQIYSFDSEVQSVRLFLIDTFVEVTQAKGGIVGTLGQMRPRQLEIFQLLYRCQAHRSVNHLPHLLLGVLRKRSKRK